MNGGYTFVDEDGFMKALERASSMKLDEVINKNLTDMFNRSKRTGDIGGTPYDTGELRLSAGTTMSGNGNEGEFGYVKDYAPHVEFGHRTRNGGYVPGQRFLKANFDIQKEIFPEDCLRALKEVL